MLTKAEYTINDLNDIWPSPTPPTEIPPIGFMWRNTSVNPNELVAWTGKGTDAARTYSASKTGTAIGIEDLADDRTLGVTVKTVATQAGSGTPSPSNVRAISGKASVKVRRAGKNLFDPGTNAASNGVTKTVNADGSVMLNGTASATTWFTMALPVIVSGQFVLSANNPAVNSNVSIRAFTYGGVVVGDSWLSYANAVTVAFTGDVVQVDIRIASGTVLSDFIIKPQLELGSSATAFEKYAATDYTLTPDATLYGLTGYADEIGSDGHVIHKTALFTCLSSSGFSHLAGGQLTNTAIFQCTLPAAPPSGAYPVAISSHFPLDNNGYSTDSELFYIFNTLRIRVLKSRLSGWSDALTDAQKVALFNTWLGSNAVQVLYQLATPATATVSPVEINGTDGTNIIASDGASVGVEYTGSGWAAVGAVQRLAVEAVSITPEEGLRVDTVLASADGAHQVPTYFNARGTKYGLFRSYDGMLILGGMVLPNGNVAGVAEALISPGASGDSRLMVDTSTTGSGWSRTDISRLNLVQPSMEGAPSPDSPPAGEKIPMRFSSRRTSLANAGGDVIDNYENFVEGLDSQGLKVVDNDGNTRAFAFLQRPPGEGPTFLTDGAFKSGDPVRTMANHVPIILMENPTRESIVYNSTRRFYFLDWQSIEDISEKYVLWYGGIDSARVAGISPITSGIYRVVFHAELSQASTSTGIVLQVFRMPSAWSPPTGRNYCIDTDLSTSLGSRRQLALPYNASETTGELVSDMWCYSEEIIVPVIATISTSKQIYSGGMSFSMQKIG